MSILSNGVANSVIGTKCVNVSASELKKPKTNWECKVKSKVWVNENGVIIENNSYITNNLPIRQFFIFNNQVAGLFTLSQQREYLVDHLFAGPMDIDQTELFDL